MKLMRKMIGILLIAMLASTVFAAGKKPVLIRFSTLASAQENTALGLESFKKEVEKKSKGGIKVEIYYSGTLLADTQDIPAILKGNSEMSIAGATYFTEYMPELNVMNMGYLYRDYDHANKVLNGPIGKEVFKRIANKVGILPLTAYYFGARTINLRTDREITQPSDLAKVKLRVPTTDSFIFLGKALGANPSPLAYSELYTALQTGVVDGQDNPLSAIISNKLYEVTKSVTLTKHMIDFNWAIIGAKFYNSLSPKYKTIVRNAMIHGGEVVTAANLKAEANAVSFLKEKGLKVYTPNISKLRNAVLDAYLKDPSVTKGWDMSLYKKIQAVK
jgi:tripartite ATP-independent transporter DctP family solute receptor